MKLSTASDADSSVLNTCPSFRRAFFVARPPEIAYLYPKKALDRSGQSKKPAHLHPGIGKKYASFKKEWLPPDEWASRILRGDKTALSRAITLVESTVPAHARLAEELIRRLLPHSGKSFRIGITGVPGAGKSTFIDRLGDAYIRRGHKVAVLAVDPSSAKYKGSILGDKTRMTRLMQADNAFIRPSPSGNVPGGVARKTREAVLLCEAAGYDRILVETVGVGQSEVYAHSMTDMFVLLKLPGAGDELQGIKRGIMELADLILINKADGEMAESARRAVQTFRTALSYFYPPDRIPPVEAVSSFSDRDIHKALELMEDFYTRARRTGTLDRRRREQQTFWMDETLRDLFENRLRNRPELAEYRTSLEQAVKRLEITPFEAAEKLWERFITLLRNDSDS
ncbi:MAG: methylmalonyl Co-A mutase-associated GTPase MeaB [Chlorobi bacterium]|nr:methylmalonyl Co-A mutase-associated GTPase MeaB [Chlorobiota bacterium]